MTAPTQQVDAVVFDNGGVLASPVRSSIEAWLQGEAIDPASFSRTLKAWLSSAAEDGTPIHRLETGELAVAAFDMLLAAELERYDGLPVEPVGVLAGLFAGMRPDPAMFGLAQELRGLGISVALLSNNWGNTYPRERIDACFDPVVLSGEVGLRKPLASTYHLVLDRLGVPAGRAVFIDDAKPNLVGAQAVGMHTVLHTDADTTRAALVDLVPTLARRPPAAVAARAEPIGEIS